MENNILGKRIRNLRTENDETCEDIAKKMGLARSTVGHWELGRRSPSMDQIVWLANYFAVTADYLLGLSSERNCAIYKEDVNGHQLEISYKTDKYPAGFSHQDAMKVIEKLESIGIDAKELLK